MRKNIILSICMLSLIFGGIMVAQNITSNTTMDTTNNSTDPEVEIKTTMGDITVRLYNDTPLHRDNFLKLVEDGTYEGVLFHRVIKDFMVQAGDPTSKNAVPGAMYGSGDPGYTIQAEIEYPKHYHKYGALAAARTGDQVNPERRSSGSQFYVVTGRKYSPEQIQSMGNPQTMQRKQDLFNELSRNYMDSIQSMMNKGDREGLEKLRVELVNQVEAQIPDTPVDPSILSDYSTIGGTPHLDGQYTVFGEVVKGMDVIEKIQNAETDRNDRPVEDIKIISVKRVK